MKISDILLALQDGIEKVGDNGIELSITTEEYYALLDLLATAIEQTKDTNNA